ncbi:MAG TPA: CHAT domain-containing protein [Bryobacteraceae bacterium]|nr:CHAT domain-containing protein [Bryobacteraceae bacterium]
MRAARFVFALLALAGCSAHRAPPDSLYRDADQLRRGGRLEEALAEASRGLRQSPGKTSAWHWRFRLLSAEILLDRGDSRQALDLLQDAAEPPDGDLQARRAMDLGDAWFWLSRRTEARRYLEQAAAEAARSPDAALRAEVELSCAKLPETFEQTEAGYRRALQFASRAQDLYLIAMAYGGLGYNRVRYGRYDEALPWLEAARVSAEEAGAQRFLGSTLGNLGWAYARLGDFDRALKLLERAAAIAAQIQDKRNQQVWLYDMGNLYQRRGDFSNAISCLRRAWVLAEDRDDQDWLSTVLNRLAEVYLDAGDLSAAREFSRRSLDLRRRLADPRLLVYSELTSARIESLGLPFPQAEASLRRVISSAEQQEEPRVAWEGHSALAALYRDHGRWPEAGAEYRRATAIIDAEWSGLRRDESKITFLTNFIRFYQQYVDFLVRQGRPAEALRVAESARSRVLQERLGLGHSAGTSLQVAELQKQLAGSRTALLAYWLGPEHSFLWLITADAFVQRPLASEADLTHMVEEYNALLLNRRDPLERAYAVRSRLYRTLLAPIRSRVKPGSTVVIVPDGALHNLNFETLVVEEPRPHYWIEDVTISVAPSIEILGFASPPARRRPRLLLIGDPIPPGRQYPPLPHLKDELAILERCFPPGARRVYARAEATPAAYRQAQPARYDVIHFAAHATPNPESPLNSAVVLSPQGETYKLYAKDVLDLPIGARLVTVSACSSAGPRSYFGEGLMGFSWAFLEAGAQHVVAGLWDVDDAAASRLMGDFYQRIARGAAPDQALRLAKLHLLHSDTLYRKPFFWAPFEMFTRYIF